jgi:hypothetical protein
MPGEIPHDDHPAKPVVGELLPRAGEAFGVRYKLATRSRKLEGAMTIGHGYRP